MVNNFPSGLLIHQRNAAACLPHTPKESTPPRIRRRQNGPQTQVTATIKHEYKIQYPPGRQHCSASPKSHFEVQFREQSKVQADSCWLVPTECFLTGIHPRSLIAYSTVTLRREKSNAKRGKECQNALRELRNSAEYSAISNGRLEKGLHSDNPGCS